MATWRVVGWIDDSEWEIVYFNLFYGEKGQIRASLDQITVWRARFAGRIPVAIEATAQLFESLLHEGNQESTTKRQCMSTALSQFVGLLTERSLKSQGYHTPIHVRGEEMGIPEWIVGLRHESAHGFIPSFSMLNKAVKYALEWLRTTHWEKHLRNQNRKASAQSNAKRAKEDAALINEKLVSALKRCFHKIDKKSTPTKISNLRSIVNNHQNVRSLAQRLGEILLDYNFIPLQSGSEGSNVYNRVNCRTLRLSVPIQNVFDKIFDLLKEWNVFSNFMLRFCAEIKYPYISSTVRNVWINHLLSISSDCSFSDQIWLKILKSLVDANIPPMIVRKAQAISNLEMLENMHFDPENPEFPSTMEDYDTEIDSIISTMGFPKTASPESEDVESWTLFEGDLDGFPIGLLPGQNKSQLWQSLSCDKLQYTDNLSTKPHSLSSDIKQRESYICEGFIAGQVQNFAEAMDLL